MKYHNTHTHTMMIDVGGVHAWPWPIDYYGGGIDHGFAAYILEFGFKITLL